MPESRPQGQPKPDPCSKVFSGTSDKEASNKGNLEEQGGFATWPNSSSVLDLALDPASAHAPDDSTSSARSSSAGSGDHVVASSGVSHSQAPNRQRKPANKSDPLPEIASGRVPKNAGSDDVVLSDGKLQKSPEHRGATTQQNCFMPKSNVQPQNNESDSRDKLNPASKNSLAGPVLFAGTT